MSNFNISKKLLDDFQDFMTIVYQSLLSPEPENAILAVSEAHWWLTFLL